MMNPAADAWLDIKQLVVDTDAGAAATTRKRQRPPEGFADLKLEFTGLQVNNSPSGELTPLAGEMAAMDVSGPQELLELVHALRLGVTSDPAALRSTLDRLALDGFDSLNAVAFARDEDLMRAGLAAPDAQQLGLAARARFAARKFQGPGSLAASVTVSRWLQLCGVPRASSLEYAELLCRLGYPHVPELELIVHDARALTVFKLGHGRLFLHCVAAAVHRLQLEQQAARHQLQGPTSDPASLMLTPLEFSRDGEQLDDEAQEVYDGFLDALMDPAPVAGMGSVDPFNVQQQQQLRVPPPELVQLLYEAVNLPRPNPCRRGKKIYWSVLATNGMKDARFARLAAYSAAELQNAYLRQFELPAAPAVKMDAWSDDNIRQLERAVKDPRCRHLSKVCWEMLATGRTGVDEYAPLAKFTASQLRSRFRSLFGDKRPQKLRQKKQMLKAQQQEAAAAAAAAAAATATATAKQEQNVLL